MGFLIGIAAAVVAVLALSSKKEKEASDRARGWSIMLQGPAALPQAAIPETLTALGISNVKMARFDSPQAGYNILTVICDCTMPPVGTVINVQGVPLTVKTVAPAPIA